MRWLSVGRAVAAVGIVAAVVLAPLPASAEVPGLPVPVQPLPGLPSTTMRGLTNAGEIGNANARFYAWMYAQAKAGATRPATTGGAIVKPSVPVTAPKPVPGVGLGAANAALSGWFAIGAAGAGVSFAGQITGNDFDQAMCGADAWLQTAYGWMTMGMGPSCKAPYLEPNLDIPTGLTLTYGGRTLGFERHVRPQGWSYGFYCLTMSGTGPWSVAPNVWVNSRGSNFGTTISGGSGEPSATSCGAGRFTHTDLGGASAQIHIQSPTGETVAEMQEVNGDPEREANCTTKWPDGTETSAVIGRYRESDGFPIGGIDAACTEALVSKPGHGPDLMPSEIKVGSTNTETGAQTEIIGQETPNWTEDERKGLDPGDGTGLKLWKIADKTTYSCMTWAIDCSNWWTDTQSATEPKTTTGTYRCTWGGNRVKLNECGPYRNTFNDPDLDGRAITDPGGNPQPWPIPGPGPNPVPIPNPIPNPIPGPGPGGTPGTDPAGECWADGWASVSNPLDWVLVPVKCALVWAFVPSSTSVDAALTDIGAAASTVAAVDPLLDLVAKLPSSSGCSGIPIHLTFFGQSWTGRLLEACTGEARAAATVVNGLLSLVLITGAVLAITRYAAAVFGFVGPGGSMEQTQRHTESVVVRQSGRGGQ